MVNNFGKTNPSRVIFEFTLKWSIEVSDSIVVETTRALTS